MLTWKRARLKMGMTGEERAREGERGEIVAACVHMQRQLVFFFKFNLLAFLLDDECRDGL